MQRAQPPSPSRPNPNQKPHLSEGQNQFPLTLMQARLSRGWTQQQLADQLGTTPQTVSRWERGIATPGPYHRGKLRDLFGLSLADLNFLFNEADETSPENEVDETSPENEAETTAANEAAGATIGLASERKPDPDSSHIPIVEPEPAVAPSPAAFAPPAPVVHPRRPAFLWRLIVGACAVAFLVAFLALIALNGQWQPAPLAPGTAPKAARPQPASLGAVGTIAFLSSEQFQGNSAAGMNDEVTIRLADVPAPAPGTSYFAWMSGASGSEAVWTPLGRLVWTPAPLSGFAPPAGTGPQSGAASLFFVAPQRRNLLVTYNRFLITQEAINIPPQQPSSAWMYQASISTVPTPGDPHHYSLLDHLRHLLAADPSLAAMGIKGGLISWLTRNSGQVAREASHLEPDWHSHQFRDLRQRLIRILTYLDGSAFVGADLPPGAPRPSPSPATRIGLLTVAANQQPPGYVLHTDIHLEGVRDALGATDSQRQEALQLRSAMNAVGFWITNVRQDALQLIRMDNTHLAQSGALALLRDLTTQAQDAYAGQTGQTATNAAGGPSSSTSSSSSPSLAAGAGVKWIESQSQQLAIFTWYRI
jgi:transcriptional regulator with XRE-family HTH domain